MSLVKVLLAVALVELLPCWAARILVVSPAPFYSHQAFFHPLWRNLSERGHQLTVFTTHFMNEPDLPNLKEINIGNPLGQYNFKDILKNATNPLNAVVELNRLSFVDFPKKLLQLDSLKNLINDENERFDLVMIDSYLWTFYPLAKKFNSPLIVLSSLMSSPLSYSAIGHSEPFFSGNEKFNKYSSVMTRLLGFIFNQLDRLFTCWYWSETDELVRKHFGEDYGNMEENLNRISLVFENTNNVLHNVRALPPNVVQINDLNLHQKQSEMSQTLLRTLDESTNGFIYVSLGTVVDSNEVSPELLLDTFKELPYTVLWKTDASFDVPKHVHTSKFFPQFSILKHKNIKLFVSQCGHFSMVESIYNEVPIICLPIYMDQFTNADKIEVFGIGLQADHKGIGKESLKQKIMDVAQNSSYKNNIRKLSKLFTDQPETGLEKAVFWTEYVLRHNGTRHLRSPVLDIPLYQYYLLDVYLIIGLFIIVFVYVFKFIAAMIKKLFFKSKLKQQ